VVGANVVELMELVGADVVVAVSEVMLVDELVRTDDVALVC
jgi:hypothetical protein